MHLPLTGIHRVARVSLVAVALAAGLISWGTPRADALSGVCGLQIGHICATLTVTLSGNGTGSFQSVDGASKPNGQIDCHRGGGITFGTCAHTYDVVNGSFVTVSWVQQGATGSSSCWSDCNWFTAVTGIKQVYSDVTDPNHGFALISPVTVSVVRSGGGSGSVKSNPQGISCGATCQVAFASGQPVTLTATAAGGSVFGGWSSGPCSGKASTCTFTPTAATAVVAQFDSAAKPTLGPTTPPSPGSAPSSSDSPAIVAAASDEPTASAATPSPSTSPSPSPGPTSSVAGVTSAPSSPGTDLTPIAIALVIAALVIAAVLAIATGILPRRTKPPA